MLHFVLRHRGAEVTQWSGVLDMARYGTGLAADALAQVDQHTVALGGVTFATGWLLIDARTGNAGKRHQRSTRADTRQLAEKGASNGVHGVSGRLDRQVFRAHEKAIPVGYLLPEKPT